MADISDVTAYLASASSAAVYPNGTSQPSVANMDVRVFEGWPLPDQLDLDLGGKMLSGNPPVPVPRPGGICANVSVYPMLGMTVEPYQIEDNTYTIVQPVYGLSIAVNNTTVTVSGQPVTGEYLTIIADRTFVYSATGATTSAILSSLATQASANYSGVTNTATTITIPAQFAYTVRQGSVGTLGKVTHRQCQSVMISVWAPTHASRTAIAAAIDVALKQTITVQLPDTSYMRLCYSRTNLTDEHTNDTVYRRDLIYNAEYATLFQFPGYVITSFTVNLAGGNWNVTTNPPTVPVIL